MLLPITFILFTLLVERALEMYPDKPPNRRAARRRRYVLLVGSVYLLFAVSLLVFTVRRSQPLIGLFSGNKPVFANWTVDGNAVNSAIDSKIEPCIDFYAYACGSWLDSATIPPESGSVSRAFSQLADDLDDNIAAILADQWPTLTAAYQACIDAENSTDVQSQAFLEPYLQLLESNHLESPDDLALVLGTLHRSGVPAFFQFGAASDPDDPMGRPLVGSVDVGGLGLPSSFYGNHSTYDPLQRAYRQHLTVLLALVGEEGADQVYDLEEFLAANLLTPEQRRDPTRLTTKRSVHDLLSLSIAWPTYFAALWDGKLPEKGFLAHGDELLIVEDLYIRTISSTLHLFPPETIKRYLQTRLVAHFAPHLSARYRNESFRWAEHVSGSTAQPSRAAFCRGTLQQSSLGWLISHVYTTRHFGVAEREHAEQLLEQVVVAFDAHLPAWLGDEAIRSARLKLSTLRRKIGFPAHWPDLESIAEAIEIGNSHVQNWQAMQAADIHADLCTVGQKPDIGSWQMHPLTVNAYYSPQQNEIVFPAAILSGQFYSLNRPAARNYGAIGAVFGHELTHGFDDEGRQFDEHGRLRVWWPQHIIDEFIERTACTQKLYEEKRYCVHCPSRYCNTSDLSATVHCLRGDLTLGENLADIGGVKSAYRAWEQLRASDPALTLQEDELVPHYYGMRADQLFFVSYAQNWCELYRSESIEMQIETDPHSISVARVNAPLFQFDEFRASFGCKVPDEQCAVW